MIKSILKTVVVFGAGFLTGAVVASTPEFRKAYDESSCKCNQNKKDEKKEQEKKEVENLLA